MNRIFRSTAVRNALRVSWDFKIPDFPFTPNTSTGSLRPSIAITHSTRLSDQCVLS